MRIQPFGACTYKNFEELDLPRTKLNLDIYFLLNGQNAKISTPNTPLSLFILLKRLKSAKKVDFWHNFTSIFKQTMALNGNLNNTLKTYFKSKKTPLKSQTN
jgi:hypothetical protein